MKHPLLVLAALILAGCGIVHFECANCPSKWRATCDEIAENWLADDEEAAAALVAHWRDDLGYTNCRYWNLNEEVS